jgi:4-amino-4-deoxy-L-arabinose transferase-like glycosyltransferase
MTLTMDGAPVPAVDAPSRRWAMPWSRPWSRPALWLLLAGTAVLYLWDLSASGWANDFYAASAQAGSMSWKAWLFASLDPGNAITVDKPPAAMWVMGLSMRLFGVNSWALLAPQALMGVGSVALLAATVRRWFGPVAGLVAGAALALTPIAVLMFRFDNPDALLVLLMTAAAYTTVRSLERGSWKWLAGTGVLLGFAFLTKMLQGFLVLPGFALAYLVAAPVSWWKRFRDLLIGGVAVVVSGGWLVALVSLWPASSRPYIAGSTNNSLWQLAIGYNGLSRIFGGEGNPGGGNGGGGGGGRGFGGGGSMFGGSPGLTRMFGSSFGLEISWLLPAALIAVVALLVAAGRAPRTDRIRAAALIWGGWTLVTALTFSFMSGIVHPYYTVALAPGIAALVAIGCRVLWGMRERILARAGLAAMVLATGVWDFVLLGRVSWAPALRWVILIAGVAVAAALIVPLKRLGRAALAVAAAAVLPLGLGSAAWGVTTAGTAHTGSTPTSGPAGVSASGAGRGGFPGGFPGGGFPGNGNSANGGGFPGGNNGSGGNSSGGNSSGGNGSAVPGGGNGSSSGSGNAGSGSGNAGNGAGNTGSGSGNAAPADRSRGFGGGGPGGGGEQADAAVVKLLKAAGDVRWAAATNGSMSAAPLQLASGKSIMAIGGFSGGDPSPTLAEFQKYVASGDVHYYISGGRGGGGFGGGGGSQIEQWVTANFTATTVGSSTIYDLTKPKS